MVNVVLQEDVVELFCVDNEQFWTYQRTLWHPEVLCNDTRDTTANAIQMNGIQNINKDYKQSKNQKTLQSYALNIQYIRVLPQAWTFCLNPLFTSIYTRNHYF